jgi:PqqD family protein of HPr-rel-A system
MKWKLRNGQSLRMLAAEDELVLYNDLSGETHLLSATAVSLLQHLQKGPDNVSGICKAIAHDWEFDFETELQSHALALAGELDRLCLIEPCPL